MKRLIIILGLILCGFNLFAQNVEADELIIRDRIVGYNNSQIDTLIAPDLDSIGQYRYLNVADPNAELDAVNFRTLSKAIDGKAINKSTSVFYGGKLSINTDPTKFNLSAGKAIFVDNYTDPANPDTINVEWGDSIGIDVTYLATAPATYVIMDSGGNIIQSPYPITIEESRYLIEFGVLAHPAGTIINSSSFPLWNADTHLLLLDMITAFGSRLNREGNEIQYSGSNLNIKRTAGNVFGPSVNYDDSYINPNIKTTTESDPLTFFRAYRNGINPSVFIPSTELNTTYYDPNGDGTPIEIPDGYWTVHKVYYSSELDFVFVQDGQNIYDSQKKAIDAFAIDDYDIAPEIFGVPNVSCIAVQKGVTNLMEDDSVKFISMGLLGDKNQIKINDYSRFATNIELSDGMSYQQPSITFTGSGGNVFLEVEAEGGGDITFIFDQKEYYLDCTNGAGSGGKAQIQLLVGSDTNPRLQYVYVTRSGTDEAILNLSESLPTDEFCWLWEGAIQSATTLYAESYSPYVTQRITDSKQLEGRGALSHERERIRQSGALTNPNIGPTPSVVIVPGTPYSAYFNMSSGIAYKLNRYNVPALTTATDGIRVLNRFTNPWSKIYNLNEILVDANGVTLNNTCFNLVFVASLNSSNGGVPNFMGVLVPEGSYDYNSTAEALADINNTSVTSVPKQVDKAAYLLARVTFRYKNGIWENLTQDILGFNYFDLRGVTLGASSGGVGTPSAQTFDDNNFVVDNASDASKKFKVNVGNVTTGTTRTLDIPNQNGEILINGRNTATTFNNTITTHGNILPSTNSTYDLGSSTYRWDSLYVGKINCLYDVESRAYYANATTPGIPQYILQQDGAVRGFFEFDDDTVRIRSFSTFPIALAPNGANGLIISSGGNVDIKNTLDVDGNTSLKYLTQGSIPFISTNGLITQDNSNLFWDDTNKRLGIGTTSPSEKIHIVENNLEQTSILKLQNAYSGGGNTNTSDIDFSVAANGTTTARIGTIRTNRVVQADCDITFSNYSNGSLSETMRIRDDGNVGIGTTTPSSKLDVNGDITANGDIDITGQYKINGTPIQSGYWTKTGGNNIYFIDGDNYVGIGTNAPQVGLHLKSDGGFDGIIRNENTTSGIISEWDDNDIGTTTNDFFAIGANNTNVLYISPLSRVGINTSSPSTELDVNGDITASGNITSSNLIQGSVLFSGASGLISQDNSNLFWDNTNKRLGIGTASPISELQVQGSDISKAGILTLRNSDGTDNSKTGIEFITSTSDIVRSAIYSQRVDGEYNTELTFETGTSTSVDERMRIDKDGNVGIGTTSPSSKLDVNGDITASGDLACNTIFRSIDDAAVLGVASSGTVYLRPTLYSSQVAQSTFTTSLATIGTDMLVNGDITANGLGTGAVYSNNGLLTNTDPSDADFKEDIKPMPNILNKIMKFQPSVFIIKTDTTKRVRSGFIADSLQVVAPNLVDYVDSTHLGIKTTEIIPLNTKAIQELNVKIDENNDSLINVIDSLEQRLDIAEFEHAVLRSEFDDLKAIVDSLIK